MSITLLNAATVMTVSVLVLKASAGTYSFTSIADDGGQVRSFSVPAINNAGTVVFRGSINFGGTGGGIFSSNGGPIVVIADNTGQFSFFGGAPTINESGMVAFLAVLDAGPGGIFTTGGTPYTTIADDSGPFRFDNTPNINDAGSVAVFATVDSGGNAIITGNGGATNTIVTTAGPFATPFGFGSPPSAAGEVVFAASLDTGGEGIFQGSGASPTTIIDSSGQFAEFSNPSFNAAGTVAFSATLDSGQNGIYTVDIDGSPVTPITDSGGLFDSFSNAAINSSGSIIFQANLDSGHIGLFFGDDPLAEKIIQTGDPLFGSTLTDFRFHAAGFNDLGEVAFSYTLLNGVRGVAVASLVANGDYNNDGMVDAADYVLWRKSPNGFGDDPGGYTMWNANFGNAPSGSGSAANMRDALAVVPEPSIVTLFLVAVCGLIIGQRRRSNW